MLTAEHRPLVGRLMERDQPTTLAGATAVAKAALSLAPRDNEGAITWTDDPEWMAWTVLEFLAGEAVV